MSDAAWKLVVSTEMLWKCSYRNAKSVANRAVERPIAVFKTVRGKAVGLTAHVMLSYCLGIVES